MTMIETKENREIQEIRNALGAVALGEPAVFWLFRSEDGDWHLRREGEADDRAFSNRDSALKALRLAAVRCSSYCLYIENVAGRFEQECFNWLPPQSRRG